MNWNGQREALNHLIQKRVEIERSANLQADYDAARLRKINSALYTRPVFLPLKLELPATGQATPLRDTTKGVGYDVIITGIKTDTPNRDIIIRQLESERPLAYFGDEMNLHLRADEIAGTTTTVGGGQLGVFYLPSPIVIKANNRITVEMFKTDTTGSPEQANIVLIGVRVFNKSYGELLLDAEEKNKIAFYLKARETPQIRFLKQRVDFRTAGVGGIAENLYTPQVEEPLLVRGCRTSLRQSLIEVRSEGEPVWTISPTPIWAVGAEDDLGHDNYLWFSRPVYLHSGNTLEISRVINSVDGVNIDPQLNNTITWICETV